MAKWTRDITGQRFGKLVAIKDTGKVKQKTRVWLCKCDCGNYAEVSLYRLQTEHTKSYGCYRKESRIKHNKSKTHLFKTWTNMKQRCTNPRTPNFGRYGGRGISVCKEWLDFQNFYAWAIANGYNEKASRGECTLDRIDNNGNYCPENCRWITAKENVANRECTIIAEVDGEKYTLSELAKKYNLSYPLIAGRWYYGKRGKDLVRPVDTIRYPRNRKKQEKQLENN